ncbi:hypothetical protein E5K00_14925 [Hymenobacter aquaticus]|uniref:Uncharacterized protein n=1 Tax=Hymenobacter aquaticus TaxID=1867101 RepID=A0A4Z0PXA9_9BACT|nr:hypothetical protein [Hymenobacter aquaticus]TGE21571.1 hypothetical protein E5K00_14925 [Hymenobacter aquaticus]
MRLFCLLLLSLLTKVAQAQHDVILRMDAREQKARVLTIRPDNIIYLPQDTATTDTLRVASAQVFMIRYANGAKELIQHVPLVKPGLTAVEARQRGMQDARRNFMAPGAFWGTYGTTIAYPPIGLITGGVLAASAPSTNNIIASDVALLKNPEYVRAYQQQAKRQKLGKAAAGFGAGVGTWLVVAAVLVSASTHW